MTGQFRLNEDPAFRRHRFAADVMLGRTAQYLIHAGFDCFYEKSINDRNLVRQARNDDRVLLTCDRDLVEFLKHQRLFLLKKSTLPNQLLSLQQAFRLVFREDYFFTRCSHCNQPLQTASPQDVDAEVPSQTREWIDEYFQCSSCERIYWRGTHYRKILNQFREWGILSYS